jgi:hypothetical protein
MLIIQPTDGVQTFQTGFCSHRGEYKSKNSSSDAGRAADRILEDHGGGGQAVHQQQHDPHHPTPSTIHHPVPVALSLPQSTPPLVRLTAAVAVLLLGGDTRC